MKQGDGFSQLGLSASCIFVSLIKSGKHDMKLDVHGVKDVIIGSRFVEDEKQMFL